MMGVIAKLPTTGDSVSGEQERIQVVFITYTQNQQQPKNREPRMWYSWGRRRQRTGEYHNQNTHDLMHTSHLQTFFKPIPSLRALYCKQGSFSSCTENKSEFQRQCLVLDVLCLILLYTIPSPCGARPHTYYQKFLWFYFQDHLDPFCGVSQTLVFYTGDSGLCLITSYLGVTAKEQSI